MECLTDFPSLSSLKVLENCTREVDLSGDPSMLASLKLASTQILVAIVSSVRDIVKRGQLSYAHKVYDEILTRTLSPLVHLFEAVGKSKRSSTMSDAASAATDSNLLFDQIEKRASLQKLYVLSARSTFPNLENFRIAELQGFRRVFAHSAPIFFERGIANPETKEISSLSVEPCEGERLVVTVFEIKSSEIPAFIQRELEFRFSLQVVPETMEGKPYTHHAVLCGRYSDEEFFQIRCKGNKEVYFQHYGRYNINEIWRDDILPCCLYLRHWYSKKWFFSSL